MKLKHTLTTCTYCGCGCGVDLLSNEEKVVGSYPSNVHPVSDGALCVKGWNLYEFIHKSQRLTAPLIKKDGQFKVISWDKALEETAKLLRDTVDKYGADSVAFLSSAKTTNEENYLMMKLARAVFKTNNIDHCARLCHASTVAGLVAAFGSGAMTNSIEGFEKADVFLVTGSSTTEQHPLIGTRILNSVHERGAKLIVFDPRKIELAKHATVHCAQKNGTDVAWINGLMHVIIKENLHDKTYIQERTENFDELKKMVEKYTPEYVEEITGVPADDIINSARIYATHKKAMIVFGMGITQHTTGVDNVKSLANLAMITGHVGFEATGVNPLRGQNNVQGAGDMGALPNIYSGYQKVTDDDARSKFEKAWGVENLPKSTGLTVTEIIDGIHANKIKALYIVGENPALSDPDSNHVRKAFEKIDHLIVQDIFLTETAEFADIVLAGASFAEKDGTFTNTERRCQRIRKAINPIGDSLPDWKIISGIAEKCGYKGMTYNSPSEIMDEIVKLTPIYGGMSYNRLDPFGLKWPCTDENHPGTDYLHKDKFAKGVGTIFPCEYKPPAELPDEEYNFTLSTGRVYWHWHTGTMTRKTSTLHREEPEAFAQINTKTAKRLNLREGSKIRVTSRRGEINIKVRISDDIAEESLYIPFHFKEAAANLLTNPAIDPVAKIPEFKVCAVKVEVL